MKLIGVLNKKYPLPVLLNGLAHISFGLSRKTMDDLELRDFHDMDGLFVSTVTDHPFIILTAKNSSQLREFHLALLEAGITCNVFVNNMVNGTPEQQEIDVKQTGVSELEYISVVAIGDDEALRPLTKRFSLFKASEPE